MFSDRFILLAIEFDIVEWRQSPRLKREFVEIVFRPYKLYGVTHVESIVCSVNAEQFGFTLS